jgi:gliding motility-associated lipoprotein GldD
LKIEKFYRVSFGFFRRFSYLVIIAILPACSEYTPKPVGYNRIDFVDAHQVEYGNAHFSFNYSSLAHTNTVNDTDTSFWFNIVYPQYRARIYCSYFCITRQTLTKLLEDSRRLAYAHVLMADGISQTLYANPENSVYSIMYDITGNVASPVQFFLTDSVSNFFRASLYYDIQVNADSVAPVTTFIRNDMVKMIESFKWETGNRK